MPPLIETFSFMQFHILRYITITTIYKVVLTASLKGQNNEGVGNLLLAFLIFLFLCFIKKKICFMSSERNYMHIYIFILGFRIELVNRVKRTVCPKIYF